MFKINLALRNTNEIKNITVHYKITKVKLGTAIHGVNTFTRLEFLNFKGT